MKQVQFKTRNTKDMRKMLDGTLLAEGIGAYTAGKDTKAYYALTEAPPGWNRLRHGDKAKKTVDVLLDPEYMSYVLLGIGNDTLALPMDGAETLLDLVIAQQRLVVLRRPEDLHQKSDREKYGVSVRLSAHHAKELYQAKLLLREMRRQGTPS